jgi:serine/threonine protein kinase
MERCELGNLRDYLKKKMEKKKRISESKALKLIHQILLGLNVLHNDKITHRDLKPENILRDNQKNLKIGDFGEATIKEEFQTLCGTPSYMPPEMQIQETTKKCSVDIWAVGMMLHEMIFEELPFFKEGEYFFVSVQNRAYEIPRHLGINISS